MYDYSEDGLGVQVIPEMKNAFAAAFMASMGLVPPEGVEGGYSDTQLKDAESYFEKSVLNVFGGDTELFKENEDYSEWLGTVDSKPAILSGTSKAPIDLIGLWDVVPENFGAVPGAMKVRWQK